MQAQTCAVAPSLGGPARGEGVQRPYPSFSLARSPHLLAHIPLSRTSLDAPCNPYKTRCPCLAKLSRLQLPPRWARSRSGRATTPRTLPRPSWRKCSSIRTIRRPSVCFSCCTYADERVLTSAIRARTDAKAAVGVLCGLVALFGIINLVSGLLKKPFARRIRRSPLYLRAVALYRYVETSQPRAIGWCRFPTKGVILLIVVFYLFAVGASTVQPILRFVAPGS